jgi:threonine aldolase
LIFASDNWPGAHPLIAEGILKASAGFHAPYGQSDYDCEVAGQLSRFFDREVEAFFVATGTAANSLALASSRRTGGVIFCHSEAHIIHHEGGAVEFQTGGAKLVPVATAPGQMGKIDPAALEQAIARFPSNDVHVGQKMALSLSQVTEAGTIYSLEEIAALAEIAHRHGLKVHMDGARFSNAVAALGCTPADMTWKAGVDLLSLGGTKNGCWCAEAVIIFDPANSTDLPHLRKRAGNLFSKSTLVSAQFDAWLRDDLWLKLAHHANEMAARLVALVRASSTMRLAWETGSSQVFIIMPDDLAERLRAAGARFYDWDTPIGMEHLVQPGEKIRRFITSYATRPEDIVNFSMAL